MSDSFIAWVADGFAFIGLVVLTLAVYGVFRMPDLYTRVHAASKTVFLGLIPLLIAVSLTGDRGMIGRSILIAVFLLFTTPVAGHAIARAAYIQGKRMAPAAEVDESEQLQPEGARR